MTNLKISKYQGSKLKLYLEGYICAFQQYLSQIVATRICRTALQVVLVFIIFLCTTNFCHKDNFVFVNYFLHNILMWNHLWYPNELFMQCLLNLCLPCCVQLYFCRPFTLSGWLELLVFLLQLKCLSHIQRQPLVNYV